MTTGGGGDWVVPIYLVCEESSSMDANGGIDAINNGLAELHVAIAGDPMVSDKFRIGLLTFSDTAEELLPLSNLSDVQAMPGCQAKGLANYGEAFNLLRAVIHRDVAQLKGQCRQIVRPVALFLTASLPTDDWEPSHYALANKHVNKLAPNIVAFGVADADPQIVAKVGTTASYMASQGVTPVSAVKEAISQLYSDPRTFLQSPFKPKLQRLERASHEQ